jgi:general secretion pathway protein A
MYESHYGFKEKPFNLNPDPDYLFMSRGHENVYVHLEYAILENKGFAVITGEIGSGKTILLNYFLYRVPQDIQIGMINHTMVSPLQFLRMVCQEFDLPSQDLDKTALISQLQGFLLDQYSQGRRVVLIVDEAQNLPDNAIEEIRLLSNIESEKDHLIQIILLGQPELQHKLQKSTLTQFAQRVSVCCHLSGLSRKEAEQYIKHRLQRAGAVSLDIFNRTAVREIHKLSGGIPRMINILCDAALVHGFADDRKVINSRIIRAVAEARWVGGLRCGMPVPEEQSESPSESLNSQIPSSDLESRIRLIEEKLKNLESLIQRDTSGTVGGMAGRDEPIRIIMELFRILKDSFESRYRMVAAVSRAREDAYTQPENAADIKKTLSLPVKIAFQAEGKEG